ncbi:MAG: NADH-quinone oxidoreductase subunit N [Deltaproteobacteria bacterium]|jgi:NADH-quinone oxidoreductase subunit N|nr:NADH-quinone oxidoreductase subunit N [Deltaproteobacteria bacterium]
MDSLNLNFCYLVPEIFLLALVLALFGAAMTKSQTLAGFLVKLCPVGALAAAICAFVTIPYLILDDKIMFFGAYRVDILSQFFKILISLGYLVAWVNSLKATTVREAQKPDYYLFLTLSAFGLSLLSSAAELVAVYLAMELASYSLYVLIPKRSHSKEAAEAALKYILFGAAATALALYGLSLVIATQHTTFITDLSPMDWTVAGNPLAVVGLSLFLGGMFFKLALFPFHFWFPDVYQGAGNETAAYVATLPKLGAIVILIRLAALLTPGLELTDILAVLAAASITYGNLCALAQKDLKRMLGFSSVAHAGYILVGLVSGTPEGLAASAFYAMAYVLMNLLCFWVICRISADGRNLTYQDLNGLSARSPLLALALLVAAFSLVGLPPTVGFIGKLWLITSAWGHGYDWLVIVVCVNTAIAIFYYLSLVRHAYAEEDIPFGGAQTLTLDRGWASSLGALLMGLMVLILGVVPGPVWSVVLRACRSLYVVIN